MTEEKKKNILNHIEAAIACGGGKASPDAMKRAEDILDGKISADEAIEEIKAKYSVKQ